MVLCRVQSSTCWKSAQRCLQPQLLLSSLCHKALGLIFLPPFDFFPPNYLVVALPVLVKGHKTNTVPLSCVSKQLSTLLFMCFQTIKTVFLLFAFVIKASFMQNALYLSQQLSPPPVMLLLGDVPFSPNAFSLLPLLWLWLCSAPMDQLGRGRVKFAIRRWGKMVKWTLLVL